MDHDAPGADNVHLKGHDVRIVPAEAYGREKIENQEGPCDLSGPLIQQPVQYKPPRKDDSCEPSAAEGM